MSAEAVTSVKNAENPLGGRGHPYTPLENSKHFDFVPAFLLDSLLREAS